MWPSQASPSAGRQLWPQHKPLKHTESRITKPQVSGAWSGPREGRLTYEGLFVGASLLHVGAWPDSAAAVVHLVHDATTQKEGKGEGPWSH